MNSTESTFFTDEPRVNIPKSRYDKLLEYEKICQDLYFLFRGDDEWVGIIPQCLTLNIQILKTSNAHTIMIVMAANTIVEMMNYDW